MGQNRKNLEEKKESAGQITLRKKDFRANTNQRNSVTVIGLLLFYPTLTS